VHLTGAAGAGIPLGEHETATAMNDMPADTDLCLVGID